jgi:hypothetical protein
MVVDSSRLMRAGAKVCVGSERTVAVVATQPELSEPILLKSQGL